MNIIPRNHSTTRNLIPRPKSRTVEAEEATNTETAKVDSKMFATRVGSDGKVPLKRSKVSLLQIDHDIVRNTPQYAELKHHRSRKTKGESRENIPTSMETKRWERELSPVTRMIMDLR